jgi:GntR family transcriptional repressor for pyruvate dehydrogenase complex
MACLALDTTCPGTNAAVIAGIADNILVCPTIKRRPAVDTLRKVKTESLRAQVYAQLKAQLMKGAWKVGEKMPSENELCTLFGVSRVTVRAAIQQLEILGLVETKHGGGTFVKDFSSISAVDAFHPLVQLHHNQDIITVLEYRKIIEKGTIGIAASKITEQDIQSLEENYATMLSLTDDPELYAKADLQFHYRIAQISRNPIIVKVYQIINEILSVAMVDIVKMLGHQIGIKYHREVIDALKRGDKNGCEALMDEHIDVTIRAIVAADTEGRFSSIRPAEGS